MDKCALFSKMILIKLNKLCIDLSAIFYGNICVRFFNKLQEKHEQQRNKVRSERQNNSVSAKQTNFRKATKRQKNFVRYYKRHCQKNKITQTIAKKVIVIILKTK